MLASCSPDTARENNDVEPPYQLQSHGIRARVNSTLHNRRLDYAGTARVMPVRAACSFSKVSISVISQGGLRMLLANSALCDSSAGFPAGCMVYTYVFTKMQSRPPLRRSFLGDCSNVLLPFLVVRKFTTFVLQANLTALPRVNTVLFQNDTTKSFDNKASISILFCSDSLHL